MPLTLSDQTLSVKTRKNVGDNFGKKESLSIMSLCFDSNGHRVKTDIVVTGFIRKVSKEIPMEIPNDIIHLCFLFWLIDICDEWDKSISDENLVIEGGIVKSSDDDVSDTMGLNRGTVFGTHIVEHGIFE